MTEILAPAGNEQCAYAALHAGADAVYLGLTRFSAREGAENFCVSALEALTRTAHLLGAKVYVALNTLVKDEELPAFFAAAREAWNAGADAILLQDLFLGRALKETYPEIVLHLSTQAGCCNVYGAQLARECGFSRVVLARETPLADLEAVSQILETEAFVQGALCTCFSGQCYLSSFAGNNSGNRGRCKQPCRKRYTVDRAGFSEPAYALSLADLSAGEDVCKLIRAGVSSLKIEGRMRSAAYVFAAVSYYRALLDGTPADEAFRDMKRAYNRGGYTRGITLGDERLLSRDVQGHIGERVGTVARAQGKAYFVESGYAAQKGDGFKILRGERETANAVCENSGKDCSLVIAKGDVRRGDSVRITTDVRLNAVLSSKKPLKKISVHFRAAPGEKAVARAEYAGVTVERATPMPLGAATSRALTSEEVKEIFLKTDNYPYFPDTETEIGGEVFAPRSVLNALRRELYAALFAAFTKRNTPSAPLPIPVSYTAKSGGGLAVIAEDFSFAPKARHFTAIFAPSDYNDERAFERFFSDADGREKYLYVPALLTSADESIVARHIEGFDGVYGENLAAKELAERLGVQLFAGTGFNLTNGADIAEVTKFTEGFAFSKELSLKEIRELNAGGYVFARGDVKVMDLGYCPYGKVCERCPAPACDVLTDYAGRRFALRRIRLSACRFELYNPQLLCAAACEDENVLIGAVLRTPEEALSLLNASDKEVKSAFECTSGASVRGTL